MAKQILIIKTGNTIDSLLATGEDFEHWFADGLNVELSQCAIVSAHLGDSLPSLEKVAGIIITGSPAYVTDLEPWNFLVADYILEAHHKQVPLLGVCYGHQLIAWAMGGEVGFHPLGREIGTVVLTREEAAAEDLLFKSLPEKIKVNASHQQSVLKLPKSAIRLAGNAFDPNHAFKIGSSTWSVQFHPEFSKETTAAYIEARKDAIVSEGIDIQSLQDEIDHTPESASILMAFRNQLEL